MTCLHSLMSRRLLYVLRLVDDHYYVGTTTRSIHERIEEHRAGQGAAWTALYPPLELEEFFTSHDELMETLVTLRYMTRHGIDQVRGGPFVAEVLSPGDRSCIERILAAAGNRCFRCGREGHLASMCRPKRPRSPSSSEQPHPPAKRPRYSTLCTRCGRNTHGVETCYARTHVNGTTLMPQDTGSCTIL